MNIRLSFKTIQVVDDIFNQLVMREDFFSSDLS